MEETIIIDIQIDQADAQKQLVASEKAILGLRKEATALRKEYDAGKISEDEYVESNLKLQAALRKETEQKKTLTKLVDTESNSRNALKAKVSQLTKEYDNLNKTTATGAKRSDELQKELAQLNAEITKSSKGAGLFKDQIGNYPEAMKAATQATIPLGQSISKATDEVKPFGVSVGGATASMSKFLTPAGAALGIMGALGTAYAASAVGARDLQRTQDLLGASMSILTNKVGDFVGTTEEGQGVFSTLLQTALLIFDASSGAAAIAKANAIDLLRQLEISEAFAQGAAKNSERRAENARRIRDDESKDLNERLEQTQVIETELSASAQRTVTVLKAQQKAIIESTARYDLNREAQLKVEQIGAEIADKEEEINGKLTENVTARRNILKLIQEAAALEAGVIAANKRIGARAGLSGQVATPGVINAGQESSTPQDDLAAAQQTNDNIVNARADRYSIELGMTEKFNRDLVAYNKRAYDEDLANQQRASDLKVQIDQQNTDIMLATAQGFLAASAALFGQETSEYKAIATASALISTYAAATKAYEAAFLPVPNVSSPALGVAFAAAAVAQGLANVASINGIQFAEGGYTGPGAKYDVAGIVHRGEYVAPQHVVNSVSAKPHIQALENMRVRGFADGGFTTSESISATQQAMIMANAVRNLPNPVVEVVEINRGQKRVEVRERVNRL